MTVALALATAHLDSSGDDDDGCDDVNDDANGGVCDGDRPWRMRLWRAPIIAIQLHSLF